MKLIVLIGFVTIVIGQQQFENGNLILFSEEECNSEFLVLKINWLYIVVQNKMQTFC